MLGCVSAAFADGDCLACSREPCGCCSGSACVGSCVRLATSAWAPALPSKWLVRCALSERVGGFVGGHLRSCLSSLPHVVTRPVLVCLYGRPGHAFMVGYFVRCAAGARRMSLCRSVVPLGALCAVCGCSPPQAWRCDVQPRVVLCPSGCFVRCVADARRKHGGVSCLLPCVVLCPSGCFVRCVAGARRKHGSVSCSLV